MKIAAYNLNSINARIENLTAWLAKAAPDVVLVQEIKSEYNNFPFFELRAAGYEAKMLGQKSYNGGGGAEPASAFRRPRRAAGF